jgi:hypothetical protein
MAEAEGEAEGLWGCCCFAMLSSAVATCCLTSERREAEIENKARKEENRRMEIKKIEENIKRKEEKRRDDERRRKEERRRRDEKKRIEKQQKEERVKRGLKDGDDTVAGSEKIKKLQALRASQPDIHRREKIKWETHPTGEHDATAPQLEAKTVHSSNTGLHGISNNKVGMKPLDIKANQSTSNRDDHSLHKMPKKSSQPSFGDSGLGTSQKQQPGRLQSIHSLDGDHHAVKRKIDQMQRERMRRRTSLEGVQQRQQNHKHGDSSKNPGQRQKTNVSSQNKPGKTGPGAKLMTGKKR